MFYASNLFMKAVNETFETMSPTHFMYVFPYACILPSEWLLNEQAQTNTLRELQDSFSTRGAGSKFQVKLENNTYLVNSSHTIISAKDSVEIWNYIKSLVDQYSKKQIFKKVIDELDPSQLLEPYKNIEINFKINSNNFYDLRKWKNYVNAMSFLCENRLNEPYVWIPSYCDKYVTNLHNLTYHASGPTISDDSYVTRDLRKVDRNSEFERWRRERKKLRQKNDK